MIAFISGLVVGSVIGIIGVVWLIMSYWDR